MKSRLCDTWCRWWRHLSSFERLWFSLIYVDSSWNPMYVSLFISLLQYSNPMRVLKARDCHRPSVKFINIGCPRMSLHCSFVCYTSLSIRLSLYWWRYELTENRLSWFASDLVKLAFKGWHLVKCEYGRGADMRLVMTDDVTNERTEDAREREKE